MPSADIECRSPELRPRPPPVGGAAFWDMAGFYSCNPNVDLVGLVRRVKPNQIRALVRTPSRPRARLDSRALCSSLFRRWVGYDAGVGPCSSRDFVVPCPIAPCRPRRHGRCATAFDSGGCGLCRVAGDARAAAAPANSTPGETLPGSSSASGPQTSGPRKKLLVVDDNAVILTIDSRDRPLSLRFGNEYADAGTFARDLDLKISEETGRHVVGRLTYFRDGAAWPVCRVTFDAVFWSAFK